MGLRVLGRVKMASLFSYMLYPEPVSHVITGNKDINAFNLVRLGVAIAHKPAIYSSPKYGATQAWSMKTTAELTIFAKRCIALFNTKPYGPYEATKMVLGAEAAASLALDSAYGVGQYLAPPPPQRSIPSALRRSRSDSDTMITSSDGILDDDAPSKRRRI